MFYINTRRNYARNTFESASLGIIHTFAPFWISTWLSVLFHFKYDIFRAEKIRNLLLVTSYSAVLPEFILSFPKPIFWINSFGIFFKCYVLLKMGRDYHSRILMLVYFGDWWLIFTFDLTLIRPGDAPTHTSVMVFPIGISEEGRLTLNVGIIDSWPGVLDWRKRRKRVKHKNSPSTSFLDMQCRSFLQVLSLSPSQHHRIYPYSVNQNESLFPLVPCHWIFSHGSKKWK